MADLLVYGEDRTHGQVTPRYVLNTEDEVKFVELKHCTLDDQLVEFLYGVAPTLDNIHAAHLKNEALEIECLEPLEQLKLFSISDVSDLQSINLSNIERLRSITRVILITPIRELDLNPLGRCHTIQHFGSKGPLERIEMGSLHRSRSLKELNLNSLRCPTLDLSVLSGSHLENIQSYNNHVSLKQLIEAGIDEFRVPLPRIRTLQSLSLGGMPLLEHVDLSPLSSSSLHDLSLYCGMTSIDLAPLAECPLKKIGLGKVLTSIDLSFLEGSETIEAIWLSDNPLEELDITPLLECSTLRKVRVDQSVPIRMPKMLKDEIEKKPWLRILVEFRDTIEY